MAERAPRTDVSRLTKCRRKNDRFTSANITRLRVIYRDSKSDARILEGAQSRTQTKTHQERPRTTRWPFSGNSIRSWPQRDEMSEVKPTADDVHVGNDPSGNTKVRSSAY